MSHSAVTDAEYKVAHCMRLGNISQVRVEVVMGKTPLSKWLARVWMKYGLQRKHTKQAEVS